MQSAPICAAPSPNLVGPYTLAGPTGWREKESLKQKLAETASVSPAYRSDGMGPSERKAKWNQHLKKANAAKALIASITQKVNAPRFVLPCPHAHN